MFWKKRKDKTPNDIIEYLEAADDAYMDAFETKDVSAFSKYCTRDVAYFVRDLVLSDTEQVFGLKRYRHREWCLVSDGDVIRVYFKKITHDPVEVIHRIAIAIADDISEEWTLERQDSRYVITDIRRLE